MSDIASEIRTFIRENFLMGTSGPALGDEQSLIESQIVDSTGFLELVAHLEEKYGITIEDEEMVPENLDSVAALNAFVQRKRAS